MSLLFWLLLLTLKDVIKHTLSVNFGICFSLFEGVITSSSVAPRLAQLCKQFIFKLSKVKLSSMLAAARPAFLCNV